MTKANITQYSSTPSSNSDINDINIAENCPASNINNAIRELMAHLKNVDTGSQALTALTVTGAVSTGALTSTGSITGETTDGQFEIISKDTSGSGGTDYGDFIFKGRRGADNDTVTIMNMDGATGNVGIGTTTPTGTGWSSGAKTLQINQNSTSGSMVRLTSSNTDGVVGTFNDAMQIATIGADPIQIYTNSSERIRFTSAGTIGIGDTTPTAFVDIACDTQQSHVLQLRNTNASTGGGKYIQFAKANGDFTGSVTQSSDLNTVSFNTTSDYRLKENISYDFDATSRLKQLKPARFNWISDENNTTIDGFIAHEVSGIVPEAISGEKDGTEDIGTIKDEDGKVLRTDVLEITKQDGETWTKTGTKNAYQGIDQSKLVPLLVKTIQELEARITALENA